MAVLLFTDMVDSVGVERRIGTEAYSRLLRQHHQFFYRVLEMLAAGEVRNDTGDGILSEFPTAAGAVKAALLFQMLLREAKWEKEAPKVRIGIHQGQLAELQMDPAAQGKLVGLPVSIASRVMNLAQGGQILMTRPVYDDARQFVREHPVASPAGPRPPAIAWRAHGEYAFRGSDEAMAVYEVGAVGLAPMTPPPSTEKARVVSTGAVEVAIPRPAAIGAALAAACGLMLLATPLGEAWVNASYDYQFRFIERAVTNKVALVLMDRPAYDKLNQKREQLWDRSLHACLLNRLTAGGCPLVVFDIHFESRRETSSDLLLAEAMRRHGNVVLLGQMENPRVPKLVWDELKPPEDLFLQAATNWGIGYTGTELLGTPRRIWPYPSPGDFPTLAWAAATASGAKLGESPQKRWLRYYRGSGPWETLSYHLALSNTPAYFKNKVVFVGQSPLEETNPSYREEDKFCPPYTRWNSEAIGGVEVIATTFLNLVNGDWLRRLPWPVEGLLMAGIGVALGAGLCRFRRRVAVGMAMGLAVAFSLAGVSLIHFTNYWFPWLIVVGGQLPCALAWALWPAGTRREAQNPSVRPAAEGDAVTQPAAPEPSGDPLPAAPEYELFPPHFGEGGFGKVWLVRNAIGQWQALKAVYQSKFRSNPKAYEAEFRGLQSYKPISEKHPGLLRIELVSKMKEEGYFYYVMELGDALSPGWEQQPKLYRPKDLETLHRHAYERRLPPGECLGIGTTLADALNYLHQQGLTHRDIKPSNVIFVNGRPKLADIGLVAAIRPADQIKTAVGTFGFMPPPPEPAGTPQADVYALGMLLYVISTGQDPDAFPDLSTSLMDRSGHAEFIKLNAVILKACQPDLTRRYSSAAELLAALRAAGGKPD